MGKLSSLFALACVATVSLLLAGCCCTRRPGGFLTERSPGVKDSRRALELQDAASKAPQKWGAYLWWAHCEVCNQCGGPDESDVSIRKVDLHNHYWHSDQTVAYQNGVPCNW